MLLMLLKDWENGGQKYGAGAKIDLDDEVGAKSLIDLGVAYEVKAPGNTDGGSELDRLRRKNAEMTDELRELKTIPPVCVGLTLWIYSTASCAPRFRPMRCRPVKSTRSKRATATQPASIFVAWCVKSCSTTSGRSAATQRKRAVCNTKTTAVPLRLSRQ